MAFEYDAEGNPTRLVEAPGVAGFSFSTSVTYDARSRAKDVTDARSGVTRFNYTGRDDLLQVTDPRSLVTQYPRNGLGDATSLISPDTGTATHTYDAAGNLKTRTDSRGVVATYGYDALNRLTSTIYSKTGSNSLSYSWTYDQTGAGFSNGIGRLTSTTHPTGSTTYTYDAQGRLLTDIQRVNAATGANPAQVVKTVTYTYDTAGNVTSLLYPSGRKLVLTYTNGLLKSIALGKDAATAPVTLISQLKFSPFGGPLSWQWHMASGTQANTRTYDASGRLIRYRLGGFVRDVTYDAADRISAYMHYDAATGTATTAAMAMNQSFGYDELGQLTTVTTAAASWSIAYDANGNRTAVTLNGTSRAYTTSATSNRLTSIANPVRTFGYDNAGNTVSDSGGYTGTYDLANRMGTLTKAGASTTYAYDGMGRRIRKYISAGAGAGAASTLIFVYDQHGQLLGEYNSHGAPLREYVWLGTTPIAMFTPDAVATNPPLVYYIHTDHLDTPRVVVDKSNGLRWRWIAEPFGTSAPEINPQGLGGFTQNLRFPGQYADQESGLNYNYFRSYDNSIGRYVQSDLIGLRGGINTYSYVGGNPPSHTDPTGLIVPAAVAWFLVNAPWLVPTAVAAVEAAAMWASGAASPHSSVPSSVSKMTPVAAAAKQAVAEICAAKGAEKTTYVVTRSGVAIPTDTAELKLSLKVLTEASTNPAASRKFVGADSQGPLRVRIEKGHPADPNFTGKPDPLHRVDHLHIDRRAKGTSGGWVSEEKTSYEWPF